MTKTYYGYTRVSTAGQGHGASLDEQKAAIEAFARRRDLKIIGWYSELQTAAKTGRRQFSAMLTALKQGRAAGVIIHKIDRSARNLADWARIGELVDEGVEVRFAHDDLDITTRGGRLTADIQAVIAADFIRNNREEVKKGMYGWLKRGYYPFGAPQGYLDQGSGRLKTIDPVLGPRIVRAFDLYATGQYSLETLRHRLAEEGWRRADGTPQSVNVLATLLRNPFYAGVILIKRNGQRFDGGHEPLVPMARFERVQAVLDGRVFARPLAHGFRFRRLIRCAGCPRTLTGEMQKGRVYYRCHGCKGVSFAEARIEDQLTAVLSAIAYTDGEMRDLRDLAETLRADDSAAEVRRRAGLERDLALVADRLERLTDAMIDGAIDGDSFSERKARLLADRRRLEEARATDADGLGWRRALERFERWNTAQQGYAVANAAEKREILVSMGSNFVAEGKDLLFASDLLPLGELLDAAVRDGGPSQGQVRTAGAPNERRGLPPHAVRLNDFASRRIRPSVSRRALVKVLIGGADPPVRDVDRLTPGTGTAEALRLAA